MEGRPNPLGGDAMTCGQCGAAKVRRAKKGTPGYWKCPNDCPQRRGPRPRPARPAPAPRKATRKTPARKARPRKAPAVTSAGEGTKEWMTNPRVAACAAEGCFFDAATCPLHA